MKKPINYKKAIFKLLHELEESHPSYTMGMHISTALSDYGDFWGISDKEFLFALEKYQTQLELDKSQMAPDEYVYLIQKDAESLFNLKDEEEDEE